MMDRKPGHLTNRMLLVCLGLYVIIAGAVTVGEVGVVSDQAQQKTAEEIRSLVKTFSRPLGLALWSYDETQVEVLVQVMTEIPSVKSIRLTTSDGRVYEKANPQVPGTVGAGMFLTFPLSQTAEGRNHFLGGLAIEPSVTAAQASVRDILALALGRTLLIVTLLSLVLVFAANRMVARPLRDLAKQLSQINPHAPGLTLLVPDPRAGSELVMVTDSFNALVSELLALNASLETKVATRTAHLEQTVRELSSTRDLLVESSKMAVLGQLVAGVAHDLNTPLGAALSASTSALALIEEMKTQFLSDTTLGARLGPVPRYSGPQASRLRRTLEGELATAGISEPDRVAETLLDLGIVPPLGELANLFTGPSGREVLASAHQYAALSASCRIMALASEKMAQVVDNLLRYSRKEADTLPVPTDLRSQLENILDLFTYTTAKGIEVRCRFDPVPKVLCRPERLQQVWINLVSNALQAMDGKGTLELGLFRTTDGVEVTVADSGPGIPNELVNRLFTPFFTTKPQGKGTGLGLSICQRIVEDHEGKIDFETAPGRTVFRVHLPARILVN